MRLFLQSRDAPGAGAEAGLWQPGDLRVWSKADCGDGPGDVVVSVREGRGIPELLARIGEALADRAAGGGLVGHLRQRRALEAAAGALAWAADRAETGEAETVAEELRSAFRALDILIGRVGVEDVLDQVFASFCLGK